MLQAELLALLQHDAVRYPLKEKKKGKKRTRQDADGEIGWETFEEEEIQAASTLLKVTAAPGTCFCSF